MAANTLPIYPAVPLVGRATLTSATAVTSRTNIVGSTGLVLLTSGGSNGARVDRITVKSKTTSVAAEVGLWLSDGTTSMLFDEIDITAVTASSTGASFKTEVSYSNLAIPPGWSLYVSETVQTDLTVFAFGGAY